MVACECLFTADEVCLSAGRDSLTTCVLTFSCDFVTGSLLLLDCGCSFVTVTGRSLTFCSGFKAATCESILQEQALWLVAHAPGQLSLSLIRCFVAPYPQSDAADSVSLTAAVSIPIFYPQFHALR